MDWFRGMLAPPLLSSVSEAISGLPIGVWNRKFVILTIRQFADDTDKIKPTLQYSFSDMKARSTISVILKNRESTFFQVNRKKMGCAFFFAGDCMYITFSPISSVFFMSCEKFFNSNAGNAMRDSSSKRYNFLEQKERKLDRLLMNLREELHWLSDYKETIFCLVQHKKSSTDRRLHLTRKYYTSHPSQKCSPFVSWIQSWNLQI